MGDLMNMDVAINQDYERILINTIRFLPRNRAEQLVDFARFLEAQSLAEALVQEEGVEDIAAENARWDALLSTNKAQDLMEKMASEALAEQRDGQTKLLIFNDEDRIAPE